MPLRPTLKHGQDRTKRTGQREGRKEVREGDRERKEGREQWEDGERMRTRRRAIDKQKDRQLYGRDGG